MCVGRNLKTGAPNTSQMPAWPGEVQPPRVVLPLSCEPQKPRLIHDARYTNNWSETRKFRLGRVGSVPEIFDKDAYLITVDDKSGYHHLRFVPSAQELFGAEIDGVYYVPECGVFGYDRMPEIYHLLKEALMDFITLVFGVPSLTYLDDVIAGSRKGLPTGSQNLASARYAAEVILWMNFLAGYTVSRGKSVLSPIQVVVWLGIEIHTATQQFFIPDEKKREFLDLVQGILAKGRASIRDLERIAGKGIGFMMAVGEAAMLYTRAVYDTLTAVHNGCFASTGKNEVRLSKRLRAALEVWVRFLERFNGARWLQTHHSVLRLQTDASSRRWGGVLKDKNGNTTLEAGEEFAEGEMHLKIEEKEALAIERTLVMIADAHGWEFLEGKRIDVWVDNLALVFAMAKGASRRKQVHEVLERLFWMKLDQRFTLHPIWWSTKANWEADAITRTRLSDDWILTRNNFLQVWEAFGPFDFDLMASGVSRQHAPGGEGLPFFSRFRSPGSAGVNLLAQGQPGKGGSSTGTYYCFPPPRMILPVVGFLSGWGGARTALVAPRYPLNWLGGLASGGVQGYLPLGADAVKGPGKEHQGFAVWLLQF